MKRINLILPLLLCFSSALAQKKDTLPVGAVAARSVAASPSVESFRPVGDSRAWVFYSRQTTFGHLTSVMTGERQVGGQRALVLKESLQVDFSKLGQENRMILDGESYITPRGSFVGCDFQIGSRDSLEQLSMSVESNRIDGFYTRLGTQNEIDLPWQEGTACWDPYLVDQLEIYLAMHDLQIGTRFDDSVFLPQSLTYARVKGQVTWFMWQEIYKGKTDSVFVINLTEPGSYQLLFTSDKKLVKVDVKDQEIRIYQDVVRQVTQAAPTADAAPSSPQMPASTPFSFQALILKLPHYFAFMVIAAVAVLMLAARAFKWPVAYMALGLGIVLYAIVPLVVHPLLVVLGRDWLDMAAASGVALYTRGAVFALVFGLIQAGLLFVGILAALRVTQTPLYRVDGLAAFLAAGFALADAVYLAGFQVAFLFDWPLLERGCVMVLTIAGGFLIGRLMKSDMIQAGWATMGAAGVLAVARFCPLLVQGRLVDLHLMHFILALWTAAVLVVVLALSKKTFGRTDEAEPAEESEEAPDVQA